MFYLEITATSLLTPNKLSTRQRPNSANFPSEQAGEYLFVSIFISFQIIDIVEEKKDFTEQLNELSTKQHQRQYSGLNQFNVFHSRSSSVEPQQQNNDEETIQQIHKEEDILEKSRQILEQSQIKNQQLAEQVDLFFSFLLSFDNRFFFVLG